MHEKKSNITKHTQSVHLCKRSNRRINQKTKETSYLKGKEKRWGKRDRGGNQVVGIRSDISLTISFYVVMFSNSNVSYTQINNLNQPGLRGNPKWNTKSKKRTKLHYR